MLLKSRALIEWTPILQRSRGKVGGEDMPPISAAQNRSTFWVCSRSSRYWKTTGEMPQPRNALARLVESGLPQDRVVTALVEVHDDPFRLDVDHTRCFHEFAIQLLGRSGVKASQLLGEPAIATLAVPSWWCQDPH